MIYAFGVVLNQIFSKIIFVIIVGFLVCINSFFYDEQYKEVQTLYQDLETNQQIVVLFVAFRGNYVLTNVAALYSFIFGTFE